MKYLFSLLLALVPSSALAITCQVISTTSISFGAYDPLSVSAVETAGTLTFRCDSVLGSDTILIDLGPGGAGTYWPRALSAADDLDYNLYTDAARTMVWGDGTGGTVHQGPLHPTDGVNMDLTIYGRIPGGQDVHAGSYADTLVVTIQY